VHEQRRPPALRRKRRANPAEPLTTPPLRQTHHHSARVPRHLNQPVPLRVNQNRLSCHPERPLNRERCVSEQQARIPPAVHSSRTDHLKRPSCSPRKPAAQLDRRPIMLSTRERNNNRPATDGTANKDRDVTRGVVEKRDQACILERPLRGRHNNEVGVLLIGDPRDVGARSQRRERRGPNRNACGDKRASTRFEMMPS